MSEPHITPDTETQDIVKALERVAWQLQGFTGASNSQMALVCTLVALSFSADCEKPETP